MQDNDSDSDSSLDDAWTEGLEPTYTQVVPSSQRQKGGAVAQEPDDTSGALYEALASNLDDSPDALQFNAGDQIVVTYKDPSGIWEGMCYGQVGKFSASLVCPAAVDDDDMEELDVDALTLSDDPPAFDAPHRSY